MSTSAPALAASKSFRDYARSLNRSQFRRNRAWLNREANRLDRRNVNLMDGWEDAPVRGGFNLPPLCWECGKVSGDLMPATVLIPSECGDSECCPAYEVTGDVCPACLNR